MTCQTMLIVDSNKQFEFQFDQTKNYFHKPLQQYVYTIVVVNKPDETMRWQ